MMEKIMVSVAFLILLISQEETPQQAFAKIQAAITDAPSFAVRVKAAEEARKYESTVLLACTKTNKMRLELHQTMGGQSTKSLAVSDGATLVSVTDPIPPERHKPPEFLSKSWTAAIFRLGFLPSFWLGFEVGSRTKENNPDFSVCLTADDFTFGVQKEGQREIKYTVSYIETVAGEKRIRRKYETTLSYDLKTYLPTKRTVSEQEEKGRTYREEYIEWLLGEGVKADLFVVPFGYK